MNYNVFNFSRHNQTFCPFFTSSFSICHYAITYINISTSVLQAHLEALPGLVIERLAANRQHLNEKRHVTAKSADDVRRS
jgi:hypothetical protein